MTSQPPRRFRPLLLTGAVVAVVICGLNAPSSTRQGVSYDVSTSTIPLYVKATAFFHRHFQYELLAREIVHNCRSDEDRALAIFRWTRQHIQRTPLGWPVVDDHILHIVIRGYGVDDQMADVFTTLCTYAGVPAFWESLREERGPTWLVLSFVRVDGRWAVFDVAHNVVLRDGNGRLADVAALYADPRLMAQVAATPAPDGAPYARYLERLKPLHVPSPLRAEKQMPLPRLVFELRRAFHLTGGIS